MSATALSANTTYRKKLMAFYPYIHTYIHTYIPDDLPSLLPLFFYQVGKVRVTFQLPAIHRPQEAALISSPPNTMYVW
jgi:hypothetical protein